MPASPKLAPLLLLGICAACSQLPGEQELDQPELEPESEPTFRINEIFIPNFQAPDSAQANAWIELINDTAAPVQLYDFLLVVDQESWELPDLYLEPGGLYVFRPQASLERPYAEYEFLPMGSGSVSIIRKRDQTTMDRATLPPILHGESLARYPNGTGEFSVYALSDVSESRPNGDLGFVSKLASETEYRPRDSSTNAMVRYDGFFWILGGWSNFGFDDWHSYSDVWKSADGVRWTLVNDTPPYSPYNSFVVWKNRMWAIGPESYSSADGIDWKPEPILSRIGNRSVVFGDALVNVDGARVLATHDGESWTVLTEEGPWGEERGQPLVTVYRDRIWVIGGFSGYGQPNEVLHNDVWASHDGVTWELITAAATWTPRVWQSLHTYDDKILMINGANWNEWPEEYGNTAEVWYTENGADWFELPSELRWGARHASYSALDEEGGLHFFGGYGHGGVERIYNDSWLLRASMYFPKSSGDLAMLSTWGKNLDGSGPSPTSFSKDHQIFILRNRPVFVLDATWSVSGAGSRVVAGDGDPGSPVWIEIADDKPRQIYLQSNSTSVVHGTPPLVMFRHPNSILVE